MALLTAQTVVRTGLEATYAACAGGGDEFVNTGVEVVHIKNASVGDIVVTIPITQTIDGNAVASHTITVTAAEERFIGPFHPGSFNDADEHVNLTYDGVTTLTVAILKVV